MHTTWTRLACVKRHHAIRIVEETPLAHPFLRYK
jgi:hypothetical protein